MTAADLHERLKAIHLSPRPFAAGALGITERHWSTMAARAQTLTAEQSEAVRVALRSHADDARRLGRAV